jgi:hypothetical protein
MNNKILFLLTFVCFTMFQINLSAQDEQETKTLFGNDNPISTKDLGFFVAPSFGITQMDGSTAALFNLRSGISFNDKVALGAYFNTSLNQVIPQSETIAGIYMDYWTVGGFAEYTLFSNKIAHLTLPLYLGYGEVQMDNEAGEAGLGEAYFFQIEPSALLEINVHKYVRFNVGAGYRFIGDMNYRNFNQSDISGLTGYIGLKFGLFR